MTQIFLIRHGQAEGNFYRRAQGQTDTCLTPAGTAQLPYLTARFEAVPLTAVYSSDLIRAYDTAEAARGRKAIPHYTDPRLREINLGIWEHMAWGNIQWDYPEQNKAFLDDPEKWHIPGAETHCQLQQRMMASMTDIGERHAGESVAVAGHGMAIRAFFAAAMGVPSGQISRVPHPANTAVALLQYEQGRFTVVYGNDTSHLPVPPEDPIGGFRPGKAAGCRDLRFVPFDRENGRERYLSCYMDAWQTAHGDLKGFNAEACWRSALICSHRSPAALQGAWLGEQFAGVISLDEFRGSSSGIGWISFLYVMPEMRGQSFGLQLIGAAVERYRVLGRKCLRLTVAERNPAMGFYRRLGFRSVGRERGASEMLFLMEKTL